MCNRGADLESESLPRSAPQAASRGRFTVGWLPLALHVRAELRLDCEFSSEHLMQHKLMPKLMHSKCIHRTMQHLINDIQFYSRLAQ